MVIQPGTASLKCKVRLSQKPIIDAVILSASEESLSMLTDRDVSLALNVTDSFFLKHLRIE